MREQDRRRRQEQELLCIHAREALADFRLTLDGVMVPPTWRPVGGPTSKLLAEAQRELAECRRLLDEIYRNAARR